MSPATARFDVRRYGGQAQTHWHPHHQIVLPLRGVLEMEIDGRADRVADDRAAVIPAGQSHSYAGLRDNAFLVMDLPDADDRDVEGHARLWDAARAAPFVGIDGTLGRFCSFLAAECETYGFTMPQARQAGGLLLGALARRMGLDAEPLAKPLAQAVAFIDAHLGDPITVDDVARAAGLSVSRVHALFRARFAQSPKRFIAARRMQRAADLLEAGDLTIVEIALRTGYGDQSAFTRAFQRVYDCSPAAHRRAVMQEKRHKGR